MADYRHSGSPITASGAAPSGPSAIRRIHSAAWNTLNRDANPFTDHRFLAALEQSGCVGGASGWQPAPIVSGQSPPGFAPAWLKQHSHGEFVFDFVWADAAHRAGIRWYPKLLVAAPMTPVTGPRLLGNEATRAQLLAELEHRVLADRLSSCAINFCDRPDCELLDQSAWLARSNWQFHWFNRGYNDFDAFLARLRSKPRKNIRRERRLAHADGWGYRWVDGNAITNNELRLVSSCYQTTFELYGNRPSLNHAFFERVSRSFGRQFLVCIASRNGIDRACSVFWRNETRLFGRYWGALEETRDVHFEACYYQGIAYCIEHGLHAFEPGAQGEHKIRRGFVPVATSSYHFIRHAGLREGIRDWLRLECDALARYRQQLQTLIPYQDADIELSEQPGLGQSG
ncbi:MAG: GNAT family N-acetyltransferase [Wenzhouxiangellaceae bacterium]